MKGALQVGALFIFSLVIFSDACAERVHVAQVLDGDSLRLNDGREIRLIGINAPEFGKDGKATEPLAREARSALSALLEYGEVDLEYDTERQDRYRRTLAHVSLPDGRSVQETMLRSGWVFLVAQMPNIAKLDRYATAEREARGKRIGVWNHTYFQPRAAESLKSSDAGFRVIEGRVQRLGRRRYMLYLDLTDRVSIAIAHQHWQIFGGDPQRFVGQRVVVRGWISARENRLHLQLSHPVMLELVN